MHDTLRSQNLQIQGKKSSNQSFLKIIEDNEKNENQFTEKIINGFDYIYKIYLEQNKEELNRICNEISSSINITFDNGAFILPKSLEQIKIAIKEKRLVAIIGRGKDDKLHFLASSMYSILGNSFDKTVIEVGGLIVNPTFSVMRNEKKLIFPINDGSTLAKDKTFGTQILKAIVKLAQKNHKNCQIIATTRGQKSKNALERAGFVKKNWNPNLSKLSCDPSCKDVKDYKKCHFMENDCLLMIYPNL